MMNYSTLLIFVCVGICRKIKILLVTWNHIQPFKPGSQFARLFDGLTDRMENRMKDRAIERSFAILKNRMESDMLDSIGWIAYDYLFSIVAQNALRDKKKQKSYAIGWAVGKKNRIESEQTWIASDYVRQLQCHQTFSNLAMGHRLYSIFFLA